MAIHYEELKKFGIFKQLKDHELEVIAEYGSIETIPANKRIFEESALANKLYLVQKGKIAIKMSGKVVMMEGPGDVFGWSSVIEPYIFTAGTWALEDTTLIVFPGEMLLDIFKKNNHIGYLVTRALASVIYSRLIAIRKNFITVSAEKEACCGENA